MYPVLKIMIIKISPNNNFDYLLTLLGDGDNNPVLLLEIVLRKSAACCLKCKNKIK